MSDTTSVSKLVHGWTIISPCTYLLTCFILALAVRVVHSAIKTFTIGISKKSAVLHAEVIKKPFHIIFLDSLNGFSKTTVSDRWLGLVIGFVELAVFPVLIFTGNLSIILAWLVMKTAGGWDVWKEDRIAFNRFLLTIIINLGIAFYLVTSGRIT